MKRTKWLLGALCVLLLAGCSLARPEAGSKNADRWVGFYVVPDTGRPDFYSNPNLTEYGSETLDAGQYGSFEVPRNVLIAEETEAGGYVFPGLEGGYSLFYTITRDEEGGVCFAANSNMGPDEVTKMESINSEQTSVEMSGIIYCAPGRENVIWTAYRVYQAADGTVYLNGSGNSYSGGGDMGFSSDETFTTTVNGESTEEVTRMSVKFREVPPLERLRVTQFDGENQILGSEEVALREELPTVKWQTGAEWALIEEISADSVKRTACSLPAEGEDPVSHQVVLMDEDGMGTLAYLNLE